MEGKFRAPLWLIPVLAMVMAVGAFAVFVGINQFSASPAEASIQDLGQDASVRIDTDKLTEPLKTPLGFVATAVTTATATANPNDPGEASRIEIKFVVTSALIGGVDQIILTMEDDWQVPSTLDRNQITIRTSSASNLSGATPPATASDAVAPQSVTVDFVGTDNDEPEITMTIGDMLLGNNDPAIGTQGILAGSTVTVVFQQTSGIRNSSESSSDTKGDNDTRFIDIQTTNDTDKARAGVFIPLRVELSTDGDPRGDSMTVLALGVEGGKTATFWLDLDGDGGRDANERDLASVVAASDDTATATFTIQNPPFVAGTGTDCTLPGLSNCNFINVRDGDGRVTTGSNSSALTQAVVNRQNFELEPTVNVSPSSANVGDQVTLSLFDFPTANVDKILIGGINVTPSGIAQAIPGTGQTSFGFRVPGVGPDCVPTGTGTTATAAPCLGVGDDNPDKGVRVPTGVQRIDVFTGEATAATTDDADNDARLTIGGAKLTLSHEVVIANQDLTITVSGFTEGGGVCIPESTILLNNVSLELDDEDNDCNDSTITTDNAVKLTSGGTATFTVQVHQQDLGANVPISVALLTEGTHELRIIDTKGSEGVIQVTIPERELEVTPISARPRDVVTIIGRNFVADNPDGKSTTVGVLYQCGDDDRTVTADPDVSGNFRETLRIPSNCAIPSDNTITATINANGDTDVVETVIHSIPDALVRVDPVRGIAGNLVTVSGEGFRTFETVAKVEFGNLGTLGGRTVNTDANGNFTITDVVLPGLDPGVQSVEVTVGTGSNETSASTSFEVLEEGFARSQTFDSVDVLGGISTLERAWLFDNTDKEWRFFDTRDEFVDVNSLLEVPSGAPIWLKVTGDTSVELNNQPFDLTCVNPGTPQEDCWNLIVFP